MTPPQINKPNRSRKWMYNAEEMGVIENFATKDGRFEMYCRHLRPNTAVLKGAVAALLKDMEIGLERHKGMLDFDSSVSALRMLDTCISELPTGKERGESYGLAIGSHSIRCGLFTFDGKGGVRTKRDGQYLWDEVSHLRLPTCGAKAMFDYIAMCFCKLEEESPFKPDTKLGMTASFPLLTTKFDASRLMRFTKNFATGRDTCDQVEGADIGDLVEMAMRRRGKTTSPLLASNNSSVGPLLMRRYMGDDLCTAAFVIGNGINGAYVEAGAAFYGYRGRVINTELGNFHRNLPIIDVDLENDFADEYDRHTQTLAKMVGGAYLGEICRRCIVKVWQHESPALSWSRHSLPTEAVAHIVENNDIGMTRQIMCATWDWDLPEVELHRVRQLCQLVFERSASLAAVAIAALALKTGNLQPALGGVTVAIEGPLFTCIPSYRAHVQQYIVAALEEGSASQVRLGFAASGSLHGAALMALMRNVE
ncbi:MAG: hypothetical protein KVP17_004342 [Porospora cf. gigantea B]|uniref:uncharacterized protein n=2 Tax=Porospora cf. gigantea B TaxID=2853592 RepID=UPI003571B3AF|nr:MAG: hypothetical protein KVP17_004342 [Porospora cf. gigantea B]